MTMIFDFLAWFIGYTDRVRSTQTSNIVIIKLSVMKIATGYENDEFTRIIKIFLTC